MVLGKIFKSKNKDLRRLPVGMTEYEAFVDDLIASYDLPTKNRTSVSYVVASIIINAPDNVVEMPLKLFADMVSASAAKQIAGQVFRDIKTQQLAEAKKQAEVTATENAVPSNGSQK